MRALIIGGVAGNGLALDCVTQNQGALKALQWMTAPGQIGSPEDVACAKVILVGPANFWIAGQVNGLDAGLGEVRRW